MYLLSRRRPCLDESLRGYAWCLSTDNGYSSPESMLGILSTAYGHTVDMPSLIRHNLQPLVAEALLSQRERCSDRYILKDSFRVCFKCLESKPYLREIWDYALLPWCLEHRTRLHSIDRKMVSALLGRDIIRSDDSRRVVSEGFALSQLLACKLGFKAVIPKECPSELKALSVHSLQHLVFLVGAYYAYGALFQPRKVAIKTDAVIAGRVVASASAVLWHWPSGLERLMRTPVATALKKRKISSSMGYLYKAVHKELKSSDFQFFVEEFDRCLVKRWPDIIDKKSPWISHLAEQCGRYEPGTVFAKRIHVVIGRVIGWIDDGLINGHVQTLPSGTRQVTVLKGQDQQAQRLLSTLTLKDAVIRLGLSKRCLQALLNKGVISAIKPVPGAVWLIEESAVDEFVERIRVMSTDVRQPSDYEPFNRLMRYYSSKLHTQADLICAVLDDKVLSMLKAPSDLNNNLFINKESYKNWLIDGEALSIPEASTFLGIKQEVAYHLVNKGFIEVIDAGRLGRFISKDALANFKRDYRFAHQLWNDCSVSPRKVKQVLKERGIEPVSGPAIDGGRQYLYRALVR